MAHHHPELPALRESRTRHELCEALVLALFALSVRRPRSPVVLEVLGAPLMPGLVVASGKPPAKLAAVGWCAALGGVGSQECKAGARTGAKTNGTGVRSICTFGFGRQAHCLAPLRRAGCLNRKQSEGSDLKVPVTAPGAEGGPGAQSKDAP